MWCDDWHISISTLFCASLENTSLSLMPINRRVKADIDVDIVIVIHIVIGLVQFLLLKVWIGKIDTDGVGFDGRVNADGILKNGPRLSPDQFSPKLFSSQLFSLTYENSCLGLFVCLFFVSWNINRPICPRKLQNYLMPLHPFRFPRSPMINQQKEVKIRFSAQYVNIQYMWKLTRDWNRWIIWAW